MAKIRWTIQAAEDTEAICKFIAKDSKTYARIFARNVFQAIKRLEKFPKSGRVVPELSDESIREIILGNYRIIYRVKSTLIEILTVYHSARLLKTHIAA